MYPSAWRRLPLMTLRATSAPVLSSFLFFFNDTATTEIYTLSLHDALPIYYHGSATGAGETVERIRAAGRGAELVDRKSTRLNSSHSQISYAVFCLKKKKRGERHRLRRRAFAVRRRLLLEARDLVHVVCWTS